MRQAGSRSSTCGYERDARRGQRRKQVGAGREGLLKVIVRLRGSGTSERDPRVDDRIARARSEPSIDEQDRTDLVEASLQDLIAGPASPCRNTGTELPFLERRLRDGAEVKRASAVVDGHAVSAN